MLFRIRIIICAHLVLAVIFTAQIQNVIDFTWDVLRRNTLYNLSFFETLHVPLYAALVLWIYYKGYKRSTWRRYLLNPSSTMRNLSRGEKLREVLNYTLPLLALDLTKQKHYHNSVVIQYFKNYNYTACDPNSLKSALANIN